jgi:hypothetical protein
MRAAWEWYAGAPTQRFIHLASILRPTARPGSPLSLIHASLAPS